MTDYKKWFHVRNIGVRTVGSSSFSWAWHYLPPMSTMMREALPPILAGSEFGLKLVWSLVPIIDRLDRCPGDVCRMGV
jgi:hypothetical protein